MTRPANRSLLHRAVLVVALALLAAACGDSPDGLTGATSSTTTTSEPTPSSTTTVATTAAPATSSTTTTSTTTTTTTTTTPPPTDHALAMADIFEVTESMPVTLAGAFTMADIEGSFRTLAAQAGAVRDHPSTDPIRDGYVLAMLTWADIYAKYGPALESVEPAAEDIEAFVNENAAITEAVAEIDAMLFDGLDTTLRARGTAGGDYLADMFGPIDDYSMIMTELTTFEVVRPSEEILLFERLVDGNQVALLALEELAPPAHLEDLHFQQVDLLADTLAVFEDFRALVAAREEPGAAEFLALGAIQRDGLALREVRSAAVTAELRGEVR